MKDGWTDGWDGWVSLRDPACAMPESVKPGSLELGFGWNLEVAIHNCLVGRLTFGPLFPKARCLTGCALLPLHGWPQLLFTELHLLARQVDRLANAT